MYICVQNHILDMPIKIKFIILLFLFGIGLNAFSQDDLENSSFSGSSSENKDEDGANKSDLKDEKTYLSRMKVWHLDAFLGEPIPTSVDTILLNFQNFTFSEKNKTLSSECLGNLGSPFLSKIYMDRTKESQFLFLQPYDNWITAPNEQFYYNTTTPYTNLQYLTTIGKETSQEDNFKFLFTVNANKYLNIGVDYEILYARGFYDRNSTRDKLTNIFGNYKSPRYEAFWKLSYSYLENFENGGITDDRYITNPLLMSGGLQEYESLSIPVALSDAKNQLKNKHLFFNHKYHIGFERTLYQKRDTALFPLPYIRDQKREDIQIPIDTITEFIPVTSLIHTLYVDQSQKSYRSETANLAFYDSIANINDKYTADTCSMLQIRNLFGISLREGFHKWAKFGLTGFVEQDFRRYTSYSPNSILKDSANSFSRTSSYNKNLLWAGGELSKRQGDVLTYDALAKICVVGEDLGDFELSGNLNTTFKLLDRPVILSANGYIKNLHPDYYLEHYYSNNFIWENNFLNEYKTRIRGSLSIPALGFSANAGVENLKNYLYFNNLATPAQFGGNIQVLSFNLKQHLGAGIINWDNDVVYQLSSNQTILPLPDLTIYSNLYLKFLISKVMLTQLGVDCRYHSDYYAPAYMPATGQFYTQQQVKIGNYPLMNLYGNFHLKRMRFFVMYSHLSRLFASPNYFSAPHYPMNPTVLKVGLSWNFHD